MQVDDEVLAYLLMTGRAGTRLLVETPVLPEVWKAYSSAASAKSRSVDLLLTPREPTSAAQLAKQIYDQLRPPSPARGPNGERVGRPGHQIAPLERFVAARLDFNAFLRVVLPLAGMDMTSLVSQLRTMADGVNGTLDADLTMEDLAGIATNYEGKLSPSLRLALLALFIAAPAPPIDSVTKGRTVVGGIRSRDGVVEVLTLNDLYLLGSSDGTTPIEVSWLDEAMPPSRRRIAQVSKNRNIETLTMSADTVKADAARRVFDISCRDIAWAVIDSGIDGSHPAFRDHKTGAFSVRIDQAYDLSALRDLVSYDEISAPPNLALIANIRKKSGLSAVEAQKFLEDLRQDARAGRPYDWEVLSKLLRRDPTRLETNDGSDPIGHGTHVAGVLAGDWREDEVVVFQGMCPDLRLYDLRVLGATEGDTEFAVIAALEFIQWVNSRSRVMMIHGVNISMGFQHDIKNFACGQTPVCRAADAVVRSGVVVVAAAGNWGFQNFLTSNGGYAGYAAISIADPGNTESVITVGSTHRDRPHEYGVSFFSSRGPTGDGRSKPDLVAPGEHIEGPLPNLGLGKLDGTSMAAPHVSGAAALLLARHSEFIGRPVDVKNILVRTATDLGRERRFQGAGLVDALRALQSI